MAQTKQEVSKLRKCKYCGDRVPDAAATICQQSKDALHMPALESLRASVVHKGNDAPTVTRGGA